MTTTPIRLTGLSGIVGVPFAPGLVKVAGDVVLSTHDGRIVPAYTFPAAHHADGSVRVVHLHVPPGTPAGIYTVAVRPGIVRPSTTPVEAVDGVVGVLPAAWLCASGLWPPMLPSATLDPLPNAQHFDDIAGQMGDAVLYDSAQAAFAGTILNLDPSVSAANRVPSATEAEPWLYDRAGALWQLYARTGDEEVLEHALRESAFYRDRLFRVGDRAADGVVVASRNVGMFSLKVKRGQEWPGANGAMYSYALPLALRWWLAGDIGARQRIGSILNAHASGEGFHPQGERTWNERHVAMTLMAWCVAYEAAIGTPAADTLRSKLSEATALLADAQGNAGAIWHTVQQHDPAEAEGPTDAPVASPWMSALLGLALVRVHHVTGSKEAAEIVRGLATFAARSITQRAAGSTDYVVAHAAPAYLMGREGPYHQDPTDAEHAVDVAALCAWGAALSEPGERAPLLDAVSRLLATYRMTVAYWTRPNATDGRADFRVTPPRKWAWQYHHPASWPAALALAAGVGPSPVPVPPKQPDPDPLDGWRAVLPASALGSTVRIQGGVIGVHSTGWKVGAERVLEIDAHDGDRVRVSGRVTSTKAMPVFSIQARTPKGSFVATRGPKVAGAADCELVLPSGRATVTVRVLSNYATAHDYTASDLIVEVIR